MGIMKNMGLIEKEQILIEKNLSNRTNVDTGEWSIMNTINQDYSKLNKCYSNTELNGKNKICQIIKYYIDSRKLLSPI